MTTTLTSSGSVTYFAGTNANSTIIASGSAITEYINQAESFINMITGKDWVAAYSSLTSNQKKLLDMAASHIAAQYVISYDMSGFTSRAEAETMLDVLNYRASEALKLLGDPNKAAFIT